MKPAIQNIPLQAESRKLATQFIQLPPRILPESPLSVSPLVISAVISALDLPRELPFTKFQLDYKNLNLLVEPPPVKLHLPKQKKVLWVEAKLTVDAVTKHLRWVGRTEEQRLIDETEARMTRDVVGWQMWEEFGTIGVDPAVGPDRTAVFKQEYMGEFHSHVDKTLPRAVLMQTAVQEMVDHYRERLAAALHLPAAYLRGKAPAKTG